ncbi:MAG TPA: ergothioneine biosynthesis protein EgtB [Candidatus Sulfotelmatobacter sp.]|nr:ergothioneine biosynthesis protein EgtB [Candidatus Sulfotelmatobacter sp.]
MQLTLEPRSETIGRREAAEAFQRIRGATVGLTAGLEAEDQAIQSMPDTSPTKWHLAHTSWFFETFLLGPHAPGYRPCHADYGYLFNSYYEAVGSRHPRPERGLLSRPTVREVLGYRAHVDAAMAAWIADAPPAVFAAAAAILELGLQHEQQHQELIVTDIKHVLSRNPAMPVFRPMLPRPVDEAAPVTWLACDGGLIEIGHAGVGAGFAFDNEGPRHKVYVAPFRLASRAVTAGEFAAFVADGGYRRADLWLSEAWATINERAWQAPLYWQGKEGDWRIVTLGGTRPLDPAEPVCHVSYFEAAAFAKWAGARLPTEAEWEVAAARQPVVGNFLEAGHFHPIAAKAQAPAQLFGDVWEWTASSYAPYPGYRVPPGAIGEYNGKFMSSQMVLRGGSCATPDGHVRATYRNFFYPTARWQFSGVRLAHDA